MQIHFPHDFKIDGIPELVMEPGHASRPVRRQEKPEYDTQLNRITLVIPYPSLNMCYRIQWRVLDMSPPAGYRPTSARGDIQSIVHTLLQMGTPAPPHSRLAVIVDILEEEARNRFNLDDRIQDPLDISIMIYDDQMRLLKTCAGNFSESDPRWNWNFKYGNGVAGRAYKTNQPTLFVKAYAVQTRTPYYYYPPNEQPITGPSEIEEEVVLALPLNHPQYPEEIYAILYISSRKPGSKLVDVRRQEIEDTKFRRAVNEACFGVFHNIQLSSVEKSS
jgi:hypothetical protein